MKKSYVDLRFARKVFEETQKMSIVQEVYKCFKVEHLHALYSENKTFNSSVIIYIECL